MVATDWKIQLRAELDRIGERAVRDDMNNRGGLTTGGEERQHFIRSWLREQDAKRESREAAVYDFTLKTFNYTRRTYFAAVAALVATIVGIVIALLHL
jgi:hypothetical protein